MTKKHGGAREGAGRPIGRLGAEPPKRLLSVRIPPDLADWLDSLGREKARIVEAALVAERERQEKSKNPPKN